MRLNLKSGGCRVMFFLIALACPAWRAGAWPDCRPEAVFDFSPAAPASYGRDLMPAVVLGFPSPSLITMGSLDVVSLGPGGSLTLEFIDSVIVDGPGPDFIVFENAFFCSVPQGPDDDYGVFAEPLIVEVSDGETWRRFPYSASALAQMEGAGCTPRSLVEQLTGLAGITPTYGGSAIRPDDLFSWDAEGAGGVSGWGGDAFDLAEVGLTEARLIRLIDSDRPVGIPGSGTEGADVDAVIALNAAAVAPEGADTDADGLLDEEEIDHGTDPQNQDSDGDGVPDGKEAASCRCPNLAGDFSYGIPLDEDADGLAIQDELALGTDPCAADSDHDGMPDGWEVEHDLDPLAGDSLADPDHDGLPNREEYLNGSSPRSEDTDGDGLSDFAEVRTYHTNPAERDTDLDGMDDGWEARFTFTCLNPLKGDAAEDPDADGLTNLEELGYGTDPCLADTDGDGMDDKTEILKGRDPTSPDRRKTGGGGSSGGCHLASIPQSPSFALILLLPLCIVLGLKIARRL